MIGRFVDRFLDFVGRLNSTNAVVLTGIIISMMTAIRYQLSGLHIGSIGFSEWEPSWDWLLFCTALQGVATTHFAVKRSTDRDLAAVKAATNPTVTVQQATVQAGDVTVQAEPTTGAKP